MAFATAFRTGGADGPRTTLRTSGVSAFFGSPGSRLRHEADVPGHAQLSTLGPGTRANFRTLFVTMTAERLRA